MYQNEKIQTNNVGQQEQSQSQNYPINNVGQLNQPQIQNYPINNVVQLDQSLEQNYQNRNLRAFVIWIYIKTILHLIYLIVRGILIAIPFDQQIVEFNPFLIFLFVYEIVVIVMCLLAYFKIDAPMEARRCFLLYAPMTLFDFVYYLLFALWFNLKISKEIFIYVSIGVCVAPILLSFIIPNNMFRYQTIIQFNILS